MGRLILGQERSLKCSSHLIFTMQVLFMLTLASFHSLILCVSATEGEDGNDIHDHHDSTHPILEEVPLTLRKCETSKLKTLNVIVLPTFLMESSFEFDYIFRNISVEKNSHACSNENNSLSAVNITSHSGFIRIQDNLGQNGSHLVIREMVALLENGYLSVANLSDNSITFYSQDEYCLEDIHGQNDNTAVKLRICRKNVKSRPVLNKCCPVGAILAEGICVHTGEKWDPNYLDAKTLKHLPVETVNPIYHSPRLGCPDHEDWIEDECNSEFYPATNGKTAFIGAYRHWEFLDHDLTPNLTYCYEQQMFEDGTTKNMLFMCTGNGTRHDQEEKTEVSRIYMACMYVGAFFHLLTCLFYFITWPKQNIHGKTLCSCTLALFFMNVFMGTAHLLGILGNSNNGGYCFVNSVAAQYFLIASFTWLLVVNIDLWWTFSSIRPDGGKGWKRFLLFSLGGWGFPLLVTGISLTLNSIYTCRTSRVPVPDYGEHICFVAPWAQGYYIYYILSILIAIAFLFAALTLKGLYVFKKGANNLRSNKRSEDKKTVLLFLKLSAIMGLIWVMEVISWAATKEDAENHVIWIIFDLYNAMSGIIIFIIFVCKRTSLNLLEQTHPVFKVFTSAISKFTSSFIGEASSTATASTAAGGPTGEPSHNKKKFHETAAVTFTKDKTSEQGGEVNEGFDAK